MTISLIFQYIINITNKIWVSLVRYLNKFIVNTKASLAKYLNTFLAHLIQNINVIKINLRK